MNNSPYFKEFYDLDGFEDENAICGVPHFLLVHGHGELNFAHLGVPHSVHNQGYIYRTPNLMQQLYTVSNDLVPVENTDFEAAMTLKQEIDKWRKDNGEK